VWLDHESNRAPALAVCGQLTGPAGLTTMWLFEEQLEHKQKGLKQVNKLV